jgi:hypothetical protein
MHFTLIAEGLGLGHITRTLALRQEIESRGYETTLYTYGNLPIDVDRIKPLPFEFKLPWEEVKPNDINPSHYIKYLDVNGVKAFFKELKDRDSVIVIDGSIVPLLLNTINDNPIYFITNDVNFSVFNEKTLANISKFFSKLVFNSVKRVFIPDLQPPYTISAYNPSHPKITYVGPILSREDRVLGNTVKPYVLVTLPEPERVSKALKKLGLHVITPPARTLPQQQYHTLFTQASLIVHHGGHGTIMKALYHGKAQLIVTNDYPERRMNAQRVEQLGLGACVAEDLHNLDIKVWEAVEASDKAQRFATYVRKRDGAREVVEWILKDLS